MISAPSVPPAIGSLLASLGRRNGLSPSMVGRLSSIERSVARAFAKSPIDRGEIGKAIYKIGRCLGAEESQPPDGAGAAALQDLRTISDLLESSLAPVAAPGPTFEPWAPPDPPAFQFSADAGVLGVLTPEESEGEVAARVLGSIDEVMLTLERNKGLPARLSKAVNTVFLYVLRAFGKSPPDRNEIADALDKVKQCLELGRAERGDHHTAAAVSDLMRLSRLLDARFAAASAGRLG